MYRFLSVVAFLLVASLTPSFARAQDATPAVDYITPDPSECTVAPRTVDNLRSFLATPEGIAATPAPAVATPSAFVEPDGTPADAETVAGVTDTVREVTACLNANSFLQMFALYTDDYMARSFVEQGIAPDAVGLLATPLPAMAKADWESFAVKDVKVLADGRVGAYLLGQTPIGGGSSYTQYLIFQEQNGRFLVDDIIFLPAANS